MQREKKTHPLPRVPVSGGSSPKCGPHRKTRGASPAPQKPGRRPHWRGQRRQTSNHSPFPRFAGVRFRNQSVTVRTHIFGRRWLSKSPAQLMASGFFPSPKQSRQHVRVS